MQYFFVLSLKEKGDMYMKYYVVDAFSNKIFNGNPAAVCVMDSWISDETMQLIAIENNLSETAFAVKEKDGLYKLRWFTPAAEIDLCGHATLATAFVINNFIENIEEISFSTMSGILKVSKNKDLYEMDFPSRMPEPISITREMIEAIGVSPKEAYLSRDLLLVLENEEEIKNLKPDFEKLKALKEGLVCIVASEGENSDIAVRTFCPKLNVNEDPVCGSAHCSLIPFWANRLDKEKIHSKQYSKRYGDLYCSANGDRVIIAGKAILYSQGEINV